MSDRSGTTAAKVFDPLSRDEISSYLMIDEKRLVGGLLERAVYTADERRRATDLARRLVHSARAKLSSHGGIDAFLLEYGLSSEEGVMLMCLAESLLRIPDAETADALIADKIAGGRWERHLGASDSLFVNASTWGLLLTGRIVRLREAKGATPMTALKRLVARSGEPVIRQAVRQAVKILGDQFVAGRTIKEALSNAQAMEAKGYRFSYDMLGEAARSEADAERYFERYLAAIEAVGAAAGKARSAHADALMTRPGISVKLSALAPRFEAGRDEHMESVLKPRLLKVVAAARAQSLPLTIDAEEQDRLEPLIDMFATAYRDETSANWEGLGIAVQAYGRRAVPLLRWLRRLAEQTGKRIPVRLVKGAYWDSEIKWAQERGLADYPVFTEKTHTDLSFLACVRLLLSDPRAFYPQIATHNAYSIASAHVAAANAPLEFQRLHGMGEALYEEVAGEAKLNRPVRIYAPVGGHEDLLAYLVRRLLENGANTSFVHQLADEAQPIASLIKDPFEAAERLAERSGSASLMAKPIDIHGLERKAASGLPLYDSATRARLVAEMGAALATGTLAAGPLVGGVATLGGDDAEIATCPHDRRMRLGAVRASEPVHVEAALAMASAVAHDWSRVEVTKRAAILSHAADLFERDRARLMAVIVREAGKTLDNALSDVREAVDFLRYYAKEAERQLAGPRELKGVTGERNTLTLVGRGPVLAISPWNFPLAIFTGQVAAALAAGNTVIAKPAPQTPLTAFLAVKLLHEAGVPAEVLALLPGGAAVGQQLVRDSRVRAVLFTGSNETAASINRVLADRRGGIIPFVAETGGINAMIADSSALPEQVVRDCVRSAFDSAGQRCSAARVLFLQNEIASRTIEMLTGAIAALKVGDPMDYACDIGPVIDEQAQDGLEAHKVRMQGEGRELIDCRLPAELRVGTYVTPAAYEIDNLDLLERETFGPILHVIRFAKGHLDNVVKVINAQGYGLTLGLHSRIAAVADYVAEHAQVGNLYVNRNQIGAMVGVQPFGGEGMSGTGPKAGGPGYLMRLVTERVRSDDITATGGNVQLLGLVRGE